MVGYSLSISVYNSLRSYLKTFVCGTSILGLFNLKIRLAVEVPGAKRNFIAKMNAWTYYRHIIHNNTNFD